jgi:hypothetical protein
VAVWNGGGGPARILPCGERRGGGFDGVVEMVGVWIRHCHVEEGGEGGSGPAPTVTQCGGGGRLSAVRWGMVCMRGRGSGTWAAMKVDAGLSWAGRAGPNPKNKISTFYFFSKCIHT